MTKPFFAALAATAVMICSAPAVLAECSIPTAENEWGATCEEGTSPFNQRDFAAQCFWNYEAQCYSDNDEAACDALDACIRDSAIAVFGNN